MKKIFKDAFMVNYLILMISFFMIEIIFRLISSLSLIDVSMVRIFISINLISILLSFLISYTPRIVSKILDGILVFAASVYACAQAGFNNFLGVYMSIQTSSQLGAVVDYIKEFIASFKWYYFLTLIPFVLLAIFFIVFRKFKTTSANNVKSHILKVCFFVIPFITLSLMFYGTLKMKCFQNKLQTTPNINLFKSASNPSLVIKNFGTTTYVILDFKSALFPVEIKDEYYISNNEKEDEEETEYTRVIDDTTWNKVISTETDTTLNSINNYLINQSITDKNEYTGMFEGKNMIMILMESANDILINEEYYPNFYRLLSGGWYWENNYSPRNSCATMNNEFSGMTSLYSIYNTCTASKYKNNTYYESIFNLFNNKEYTTFSAHDYTEAYYPRSKIHTNMGSSKYYGVQDLNMNWSNEYRNWANDDEFMQSILNILNSIDSDSSTQYMTWLTTVSSHQPYSVSSTQGDMYYDMTEGTNYPSDVRRYMSKLKILDNALGVLLEGLEARGELDDTVIVLYGDHYPYGISTNNLNKVLDYNTAEDLNAERVPFVIWSNDIEPTVHSEYTDYLNILPTLANLFDLDYDPRLYLGTDLLSEDYESLTVFADGSWKNEVAFYDATKGKIKYYGDKTYTSEEITSINNTITTKVNISSDIIKNNYFEYLSNALSKIENTTIEDSSEAICLNSEKDLYTNDSSNN